MIRKLKTSDNSIAYIAIFIIVFLTQFSYIQYEVIDWDESTYFLISKYASEGSVLYVEYWEAKPPIFFLYLGIIFKIFGATLLVGRLAGDLLILLSDIDGLYSSNPIKYKNAEKIKKVRKIDDYIEKMASSKSSNFGSGGMTTKIIAAKICMSNGCATIITSSNKKRPRIFCL